MWFKLGTMGLVLALVPLAPAQDGIQQMPALVVRQGQPEALTYSPAPAYHAVTNDAPNDCVNGHCTRCRGSFLQRFREWWSYRPHLIPRGCRGCLFECGSCRPRLFSFFLNRYGQEECHQHDAVPQTVSQFPHFEQVNAPTPPAQPSYQFAPQGTTSAPPTAIQPGLLVTPQSGEALQLPPLAAPR